MRNIACVFAVALQMAAASPSWAEAKHWKNAPKVDTWEDVIQAAKEKPGARDVNGRLRYKRDCSAETGQCSNSLLIVDPDGPHWEVKEFVDADEIIISKWICKINRNFDMMSCSEYDTAQQISFVKENEKWVRSK
jgi:hypothetical protein